MKIKTVSILLVLMLLVTFSAGCAPTPAVEPEPEPIEVVEEPEVVVPEPEEPAVVEEPEEPEVVEETEEAEPVTLEVWFLSQSPEGMALVESVGQQFSDIHPNVTIEFSVYTFEDMNRTLRLALDGGAGPDIANTTSGLVGTDAYARAGHLVDLTDTAVERGWVENYGQDLLTFANLFAPDQRTFGIPTFSSTVGVYYNSEIFEEYGLSVPATFEEFENILATLKDNGITPMSVGALDGWPLGHYWEQLVHANVHIDELTKVFTLNPEGDYTAPEFLAATEKLVEWAEKGYFQDNFMASSFADANNLFITGQAAMNIGGTWMMHDFSSQPEFTARFFALPRMNMDIPWHAGGNSPENNWMVSKYSDHVDWAIEFVDYILSEETAQLFWSHGELTNFKFDVMPEPVTVLHGEIGQTFQIAGPGYYLGVTGELLQGQMSMVQELAMGNISPEAALAEYQLIFLESVARESGE